MAKSPTSYAEIVPLAKSRCQGEGLMALHKHQEGLGICEDSSESRRELEWRGASWGH
jgi:hypothetical protein